MKVVESYILRRALGLFVAALVWTCAIVWTTQVLTRIDLVTDKGQSALTFFEIASLILPSVIPVVTPFAIVIAVAQTLTLMNNDSELVVINAAGSSRLTTIRPMMILAVGAAIFSFAIDNGVDPYARERGRQLIGAARADLLSLVIQEGTFRTVEDGVYIQVGERLPDGQLGQIFVADTRDPKLDLAYYAKTGAVMQRDQKNLLVMTDGEVHRKADGQVSVIRFTSYSFDLSAFSAAVGNPTMFPKDRTLPYLMNPDPNDKLFRSQPQLFRAELHRRLTEWLYPIVFGLIALAVTGDARSHREARLNPLITAITISLFVRWLGFFAANQTQSAAWFAPFVYAAPLGAAVLAMWFIVTNRTMELPMSAAERLLATIRRVSDRMLFLHLLPGRRRPAGGSA